MTLRRREALTLAAVAVGSAIAGFVLGPRLLVSGDDAGKGGQALREARFTDLAGRERSLSEWQGKILVVNFWATWCTPCIEEIPMLMSVREAYAHSGIEIVGIAVDSAAKVSEFAAKIRITYPLMIADGGALELMRRLGNRAGGLPFTVLVDRNGTPNGRKLGALQRDELERLLAPLTGSKSG